MLNAWKAWPQEQDKRSDRSETSIPFTLKENYSSTMVFANKKESKRNMGPVQGTVFLAQTLKEEVMMGKQQQRKKNLKQLKKMYVKFITIAAVAGVGIAAPLTAFAQTPTQSEITPSVVMDWGMTLALIVVAIGVALSVSLLAFAGIYRMFKKGKEAEEWTTDIIKGLVQVLVSVPLVYALFQLAQVVFRNLPFLDGLM